MVPGIVTQASSIHYIKFTSLYHVTVESILYVRMRHDATRMMSMKMAVRLLAAKTTGNMTRRED